MPKITYISADGETTVLDVPIGQTVMSAAVQNTVDGIVGECGGGAMCGTCHVFIDESCDHTLPGMRDVEDDLLHVTATPRQSSSRLSCQLMVTDELNGLVVHTPETQL